MCWVWIYRTGLGWGLGNRAGDTESPATHRRGGQLSKSHQGMRGIEEGR